MDFVPAPTGSPSFLSIAVPLLVENGCRYRMDQLEGDYRGFPRRVGFVGEDGELDLTRSQDEIAGFLQAWLYFGLLASLVGPDRDQDRFTSGQPPIVNSVLVAEVLDEFGKKASEAAKLVKTSKASRSAARRFSSRCAHPTRALQPQREAFFLTITEHLQVAAEAVHRVEVHFREKAEKKLATITLSIKVLLGTLMHITYEAYECYPSLEPYELSIRPCTKRRQEVNLPASRLLLAHLLKHGWCRQQADVVLSYPYDVAYFFARLQRSPRDHSKCVHKCVGWNAHEGKRLNDHREDGCKCLVLAVSTKEVAEIIRGGGTPLVRLRRDSEGKWTLQLIKKRRSVMVSSPSALAYCR